MCRANGLSAELASHSIPWTKIGSKWHVKINFSCPFPPESWYLRLSHRLEIADLQWKISLIFDLTIFQRKVTANLSNSSWCAGLTALRTCSSYLVRDTCKDLQHECLREFTVSALREAFKNLIGSQCLTDISAMPQFRRTSCVNQSLASGIRTFKTFLQSFSSISMQKSNNWLCHHNEFSIRVVPFLNQLLTEERVATPFRCSNSNCIQLGKLIPRHNFNVLHSLLSVSMI